MSSLANDYEKIHVDSPIQPSSSGCGHEVRSLYNLRTAERRL